MSFELVLCVVQCLVAVRLFCEWYSKVGVAQVMRYEIHTTNSMGRASVVSAEWLNNVIENGRCSYQ